MCIKSKLCCQNDRHLKLWDSAGILGSLTALLSGLLNTARPCREQTLLSVSFYYHWPSQGCLQSPRWMPAQAGELCSARSALRTSSPAQQRGAPRFWFHSASRASWTVHPRGCASWRALPCRRKRTRRRKKSWKVWLVAAAAAPTRAHGLCRTLQVGWVSDWGSACCSLFAG